VFVGLDKGHHPNAAWPAQAIAATGHCSDGLTGYYYYFNPVF
jgi:hypothetical protein